MHHTWYVTAAASEQVTGLSVDDDGHGWWRVRNSFGSSWGESGFAKIAWGENAMGITTRPTFVSVEYKDGGKGTVLQ